ncbi:MAG: SDR family NAD(P)-dependent oxidoreductase [Syntrophorhabdaceae bacterium]|nr:SDR family NAD(P)-dependent oxidoreductase [Syntrophorhabdaceae bacterium]
MNIMVFGASSSIGASVAESFSPGNNLFLTGRNASGLKTAARRCMRAGASDVVEMVWDLGKGPGGLEKEAAGWRPDIVVNAASASSRLRDGNIAAEDLEKIVAVDLTAPLDVIRAVISDRCGGPIGIVYISSFLSVVPGPDRAIYGALKRIHEKVLLGLAASHPEVRLMIVRISKRISSGAESREAEDLGAAVVEGYQRGKKTMYHGVSGRFGMFLFYVQPVFFTLGVKLKRLIC